MFKEFKQELYNRLSKEGTKILVEPKGQTKKMVLQAIEDKIEDIKQWNKENPTDTITYTFNSKVFRMSNGGFCLVPRSWEGEHDVNVKTQYVCVGGMRINKRDIKNVTSKTFETDNFKFIIV